MSIQRLNAKRTGRIAALTGLDVIRAWTTGDNHVQQFVTRDDKHGIISDDGTWVFDATLPHTSTCSLIDPTEPSGYRESNNYAAADEGPAQQAAIFRL